jgi:hypothetical protein
MTSSSLVNMYQGCRGTYWLRLPMWRCRQHSPPEPWNVMTKLHSITIQDTAVLIHCREHRKPHALPFASQIVLSCSFTNSLEVAVSWNKQQFVLGSLTVRTSLLKSVQYLFGVHTLGLTKVSFNCLLLILGLLTNLNMAVVFWVFAQCGRWWKDPRG